MKYQVLFSLKNNEKIFMSSAAVMIGALGLMHTHLYLSAGI